MQDNPAEKIAIVLAAFNGDKYIEEQIESLQAQTYPHWELFVSDDLSTDDTLSIVRRLSDNDPRITVLESDVNRGVTLNFLNALDRIYRLDRFAYFMFCDQDDIWLPNKIELTYQRMKEEEKESDVVLVHTDLIVVDESACTVKSESFQRYAGLKHIDGNVLPRLLAQPFVFGCTAMMNRELVRRMYPIPGDVYAHDSWASLIAAAAGTMAYLNIPTIRYRQHMQNVSGGAAEKSLRRRIRRVTIGLKKQVQITESRIRQCAALLDYLDKNSDYYRLVEDYCLACRKNAMKAIRTSLKRGVLRQGILANVLYLITLIFIERRDADER